MEQSGQKPDPFLKQFGHGGVSAGYTDKLQVIEQLRSEYFQATSAKPKTVLENINAVPLDYINQTLVTMNEPWRARIVNDQYEFFIPRSQ
jgi:hypothetical protein